MVSVTHRSKGGSCINARMDFKVGFLAGIKYHIIAAQMYPSYWLNLSSKSMLRPKQMFLYGITVEHQDIPTKTNC